MTVDQQTFSDGRSLTKWLVDGGAPELPEGLRYTLEVISQGGHTKVTARIMRGHQELAAYSTHARINVGMAAVSAATYAFEEKL